MSSKRREVGEVVVYQHFSSRENNNSLVSIRSEKVTLSEPPFQNKRTGSLVKDLINKEQIR